MKAKSERRRPFIGNQIEECRDVSGLFYILSFQKGYLINWDIQKTVWDYMFSSDCCKVNFTDTPLIITEPQFNFNSIQEAMLEIFFEEYDCDILMKATAADLASNKFMKTSKTKPFCCVVVDMGYSFTHIVPFIKGKKVKSAIRRIEIGGKLLTNHLKEILSYRQLNVMDETYVINQVKEDSCFVSQNFTKDMHTTRKQKAQNSIVKDYVLPDFTSIQRGYLRDSSNQNEEDYQILRLNNERFAIPEILFHPSDVGIRQKGIPETVIEVVEACPAEAASHLLYNIIIIGGCALFPGMQSRLQAEIRALAPDDIDIRVTVPANPITYAWEGGKTIVDDPNFTSYCVTRQEYEEEGTRGIMEKSVLL